MRRMSRGVIRSAMNSPEQIETGEFITSLVCDNSGAASEPYALTSRRRAYLTNTGLRPSRNRDIITFFGSDFGK